MAMETRLQMKLTQKLVMSQNLQLAIKLLQMTKMELEEVVSQEILENPVLEIVESEPAREEASETNSDLPTVSQIREEGSPAEKEELAKLQQNERALSEVEWEMLLDDNPDEIGFNTREDRDPVNYENFIKSEEPSLYDHLVWQLSMATESPETVQAAMEIIAAINSDGYLTTRLEDIAQRTNIPLAVLEDALDLVQSFEPIGVGARDPRECLLLQIQLTPYSGTIVEKIISDYLPMLERNAYAEIAKQLGVHIEEVKEAVAIIKRLEPKPGREYSSSQTQYITPDVYIVKIGSEYKILLNDDGIPRLRISPLYRSLLQKGDGLQDRTRRYIEKKCRGALWLIKSIDQRQRTIYKVCECILAFQKDFFDKGIHHLRPLTLRTVAEEINMSESTVSRVSTNKYMHTPQGLFELKFFFHSGLDTTAGGEISSLRVKEMIKTLINGENALKPLSDQDIVKGLTRLGVKIARRTVAKYREELKIPTASRRKSS